MKRQDINGFTLYFLNYSIEFVTIKHFLRGVYLWKNEHKIKGLDF